jgi:hypothetical protein
MTVRTLAELVQERIAERTGARPPLRAPAAAGPGPEPYRVDPGRLAALGLGAQVPLARAIDDLIDLCRATTSTGANP